jgi:uncharacterized protein YjbJ (UPF0337 family)
MGELIDRTKGRIKQSVGALIGNQELTRAGQKDERRGQIEGAFDDVKRAVKGSVKETKNALKRVSK